MTRELPEALPGISVFGLGKLGAVVAGCHAQRGFRVIGFDVRSDVVEACRQGRPSILEPGIEALYAAAAPMLTATTDAVEAVRETDVTMLVVPTPSRTDGGYALDAVLEGCETIGKAIRDKRTRHLVILKSTVMPGASSREIVPALERASGRRVGADLGYCYNPEFIALGSVIRNIYHPDLVLIGESDESAGDVLSAIYARLLEHEPPLARMSYANAELAKLAVNSFVTMKITFANLLARLCERLPGGDVDRVTEAIGRDVRIGSRYLRGGLGFGGPCFPRDNKAMACLARELGLSFSLADATDAANQEVSLRVVDMVAHRVPARGRVAVLGLSYKPDTPVVEESQGVLLASALAQRGFRVVAHDPQAMENARRELADRVAYATSVEDCVADADAIVIATAWPEFAPLPQIVKMREPAPLIVDCWGMLDTRDRPDIEVLRLGTYHA